MLHKGGKGCEKLDSCQHCPGQQKYCSNLGHFESDCEKEAEVCTSEDV
jgi:hypothetical protein